MIALLWLACNSGQDDQKASAKGEMIFGQYCKTCHGANGKLGLNGAKDLTLSKLSLEERINTITNGRNMMTPFKAILSAEDIEAVASYTMHLQSNSN